jgi:hypothetical protein
VAGFECGGGGGDFFSSGATDEEGCTGGGFFYNGSTGNSNGGSCLKELPGALGGGASASVTANNNMVTGLADLKFGRYQIADTQWNVGACLNTATCQIFSKTPGSVYRIPASIGQLSWAVGDYVSFARTNDTANPFNATQYASDGAQKAVMGTGHIVNMGPDFFFFVGNDDFTGALFSMTSILSGSTGLTWTGTLNPNVAQVNAYAANATTPTIPAGAEQTRGPAGSSSPLFSSPHLSSPLLSSPLLYSPLLSSPLLSSPLLASALLCSALLCSALLCSPG